MPCGGLDGRRGARRERPGDRAQGRWREPQRRRPLRAHGEHHSSAARTPTSAPAAAAAPASASTLADPTRPDPTQGNSLSERGITATRDMAENELLISIPYHAWGTAGDGTRTPTGAKMIQAHRDKRLTAREFSDLDYLVGMRSHHWPNLATPPTYPGRTENSQATNPPPPPPPCATTQALWILESDQTTPYIVSLPSLADLSHVPVFWSDSDRAHLNGTDLYNELDGRLVRWGRVTVAGRRGRLPWPVAVAGHQPLPQNAPAPHASPVPQPPSALPPPTTKPLPGSTNPATTTVTTTPTRPSARLRGELLHHHLGGRSRLRREHYARTLVVGKGARQLARVCCLGTAAAIV